MADGLQVTGLNAWFGTRQVLMNVSLRAPSNAVTALIGPSGCGKSTFVRCINRMHEVVPGARSSGQILLNGDDLYGPGVDPVMVRRRIGMVFQKPNAFPPMSVFDNVAAGHRLAGVRDKNMLPDVGEGGGRSVLPEGVERAHRQAELWDGVKDELDKAGSSLSGGQQQRLCIARAVAVQPEVLLMDEPCSALDPIATARIEELILDLK